MFGPLLPSRPAVPGPPPPLPALEPDEREETVQARARIEPKWRAFDALLADFAAGDRQLRRRPR